MANHPTLMVWRTNDTGAVDHAALLTTNYYISFWPLRYVETRFPEVRASQSFEEPGCIVFSPELDINIQRGNQPHSTTVLNCVTDADVEVWYEEFLLRNRIDIYPAPVVTRSKASEVLHNRNAENGHEQQTIDDSYDYFTNNLSKFTPYTKYSVGGHILLHKPFKNILSWVDSFYRFYEYPQNSVAFIYNLIESGDNHVDTAFPTYISYCSFTFRFYCHIFTGEELEDIANRYFSRERKPKRWWYRSILDTTPFANRLLTKITGYNFKE